MTTETRTEMVNRLLRESEDPEAVKAIIPHLEPFKRVKAIRELRAGGNMNGVMQFYVTDPDEMIELHAKYAEVVQRSHEFYMEDLSDEKREFLLRETQNTIGYIYRHIEAWIPYSLFFDISGKEIAGVGFFFHIALVDVGHHLETGREVAIFELEAAEEVLGTMLQNIDSEDVEPEPDSEETEEHLLVLFDPEDTKILKALASSENELESVIVRRALQAEMKRIKKETK
jgi:hypothetical protein